MKFKQNYCFNSYSNFRRDEEVQLFTSTIDQRFPLKFQMSLDDPFYLDSVDHLSQRIDDDFINIETPDLILIASKPFSMSAQPFPQVLGPQPQHQEQERQQLDSSVVETQSKTPIKVIKKEGYHCKNFLQDCKKLHFKYIERKKGADFIKKNQTLRNILKKPGISRNDYLTIYKMNGLKQIWQEFFKNKVLYRELMLTRSENLQKLRFQSLLFRYQEAFKQEKFDYIMPEHMKTWKLFQKIEKVKLIRKEKKQPSYSTQSSQQYI